MEHDASRSHAPCPCARWITALVALATSWLGACSAAHDAQTWQEHYSGDRAALLATDQPVELVEVDAATVLTADSDPGWRRLGESRFVLPCDHRNAGLEQFARSIGATRVLWNSYSMGFAPFRRTFHAPATTTSRTTGDVTDADGTTRHVDLSTTTQRWEDRTVEGSQEHFHHSAVFFAPLAR